MTILQVSHLHKAFTDQVLLADISFSLLAGERVGLIGANGSGKTTLLRILAGIMAADSGDIQLAARITVGLLQQLPDPQSDLGRLQAQTAAGDAPALTWQLHLDGLSFSNPHQADTLSGGERTRLALSRFLAEAPDLMLMDEPTNNLDLAGIQAVTAMLRACAGSMIIVSHDRYLLDQVTTRILELDEGRIESYSGNYSFYRTEKERRHEEKVHQYAVGKKQLRLLQEEIQQKKQWADKAHRDATRKDSSGNKMGLKEYKRVKAGKLAKKAKNDIRRLERLQEEVGPGPRQRYHATLHLSGAERHGKRILEAAGLGKSYNGRILFNDSQFYLLRGEKAALFGPNGCGKTTLVRLICGEEAADSGTLTVSPSSPPVVMPQLPEPLPETATLLQYLSRRLDRHLDGQDRATLDQMGFEPHHLQLPAARISPGQLVRLRIAELILTRQDFLILDEPTNYLDLQAREQLETALANVKATLLIVSHDRYLLQRVCNKVLAFERGRIVRHEESFAGYCEKAAPFPG